MSDHEIITQHFDDPIGSVIKMNGKCYVKVSNKTHTITHPLTADRSTVYYSSAKDCGDGKYGKMLCPPDSALYFTVGETAASALMTFDLPFQAVHPTSMQYTGEKPITVTRVNVQTELQHPNVFHLPTQPEDTQGIPVQKTGISRAIMFASFYTSETTSLDIINKILHKQ